ncbi:MAG: hypothetical protein JWO82_363, partial [Akkermansiaceae bacterium]|nr:hypothetical protein [Akkermansiaceae bacterium]
AARQPAGVRRGAEPRVRVLNRDESAGACRCADCEAVSIALPDASVAAARGAACPKCGGGRLEPGVVDLSTTELGEMLGNFARSGVWFNATAPAGTRAKVLLEEGDARYAYRCVKCGVVMVAVIKW